MTDSLGLSRSSGIDWLSSISAAIILFLGVNYISATNTPLLTFSYCILACILSATVARYTYGESPSLDGKASAWISTFFAILLGGVIASAFILAACGLVSEALFYLIPSAKSQGLHAIINLSGYALAIYIARRNR